MTCAVAIIFREIFKTGANELKRRKKIAFGVLSKHHKCIVLIVQGIEPRFPKPLISVRIWVRAPENL